MEERLRRLITLGKEHYQANELDRAERCFVQVVKEHRGFADIFNMLGVIYHGQGRFGEAEEAFEEALRINPSYTEAALNLAVTYNDLGKYALARDVYAKAIGRSRGEPRSLDPFARGKLANMHAEVGDAYAGVGFYPEAIREYQRALELCPAFVDLRTSLANLYRDAGDLAAALRELEIARTMNPRYLPARVALGVTLLSLGRKADAVREWEEVVREDPGHRTAHSYLQMVKEDPSRGQDPAKGVIEPSEIVIEGLLDDLENEK